MNVFANRVLASYFHNPSFYLASIIVALTVLLFWGGLSNIFSRWSTQAEYSHGFFIPLVSLYILWEKRRLLAAHFSPLNWLGLPVCFVALVCLFIGEISALYILIHYAFLVFLFGMSLCFLGRNAKYTLVSIALLAFAIPLPYVIEVLLTAKMQLLSSAIGVEIIRWFNIPVYLSGNVIDMGEFKLHVVEACSGLRYLFPLACIGFVVAYFYRSELWKRVFVFLSTIPITIILNSFRIAVSGLIVEHLGIDAARGFLHDFEGWIVFLLCMLALLGEIVLIERLTSKRPALQLFKPVNYESVAVLQQREKIQHSVSAVLSTLLIVSIWGLNQVDQRKEADAKNISFASFPMNLDSWQGQRAQLDWHVVEELGASDYILADFHRPGNPPINFYVAFYGSQRKGISPHSPKVCIPGGGWEIAEFRRTALGNFRVNQALIRHGNDMQLVYYWFIERGEVVANEYYKKWLLLRDALTLNRTDGALVRLVLPLQSMDDVPAVEQHAQSLFRLLHPRLLTYLPAPPPRKESST